MADVQDYDNTDDAQCDDDTPTPEGIELSAVVRRGSFRKTMRGMVEARALPAGEQTIIAASLAAGVPLRDVLAFAASTEAHAAEVAASMIRHVQVTAHRRETKRRIRLKLYHERQLQRKRARAQADAAAKGGAS
jgi:hypothetical protein